MKYKLIQKRNIRQWGRIWVGYWRLWGVLIRIHFKQQAWLRDKITLQSDASNGSDAPTDSQLKDFSQLHEAVRLASRLHFIPSACLPRSIVLADILCARGYQAEVLLGVTKVEDSLVSHAWVEVNGVKIAEPESQEQRFTPI